MSVQKERKLLNGNGRENSRGNFEPCKKTIRVAKKLGMWVEKDRLKFWELIYVAEGILMREFCQSI